MAIRKLSHLIHVVDDFDAASAAYQAVFAPQVVMPKSWSDFDKRWASLATIGPDFVLEVIEPSKAGTDAESPLPKFHRRHGDHLHSLSWYVDDDDFGHYARRMQDGGIRVLMPYDEPHTFFTHPKDTFGQLEFQTWSPDIAASRAPHTAPGWTGTFWRDEHPLGLLGMSHLTTIVSDLDRAKALYEKLLDAPAFHEETGPDRISAFAMVGDDTVVELAQPTEPDSALAHELAEHGELPGAMTFQVKDLDDARTHIASTGLGFTEDAETITLDRAAMANTVVAVTVRSIPNDPRS